MKISIFLFLTIVFLSCTKKADKSTIPFSEASYRVIVSMDWTSPKLGVPAGAHVTRLIGMIHGKDTSLWMPGRFATPGLEDVAEIGNNARMNAELDAILLKNKALSKFTITPPPIAGTIETNLIFNTNYSYITFVSMIAPSPDWFMGVHDFFLFDGKMWVNDTTLNLMVYDAGTEDGDMFAYDNPATSPQQSVSSLTASGATVLANGNTSVASIGIVRFIKN